MSYNDYNLDPNALNAFRQTFGPDEISPVGGHAGKSHFGYVPPLNPQANNPGFHVTTEVPGMKQGTRIPIHDYLTDFK